MAYVSVYFIEKKGDEYIYDFRPLDDEKKKGIISINCKTGEHSIIQESSEYKGYMGHAFSILRKFRKENNFEKSGFSAWG